MLPRTDAENVGHSTKSGRRNTHQDFFRGDEVASSPELSVVCDLDGKDEADDYDEEIVVYKDLRNHEHDLVRGPMNDLICRGAIQKDRFVSD